MNRMQIAVLGVSVAAFGAAYFFFNSWQAPRPAVIVQAPRIETDEVLVASQDIPMGSALNETLVGWQVWPKPAVSELMIAKSTSPHELDDVKGTLARNAFMRGEPIRRDKLVRARYASEAVVSIS